MKYYLEDINMQMKKNAEKFIGFCEKEYYENIRITAQDIADNRLSRPVVLICGPSGSGKTTTAMILEHYLDTWGYETHTISLDNYFKELSVQEFELAKQGKVDLESPLRLDKDFLNRQLNSILNCESVDIPKYDFGTGQRKSSGWTLTRKENDIVIFEGTHSLNPEVVTIDDEKTSRIFVGIRSSISTDKSELTSQSIRLLRRMVRDRIGRDRSIEETLGMKKSVDLGEEKYIRPYIYRCTHSIDTLIPYELCVYRTALFDMLTELCDNCELSKLYSALSFAQGVDLGLVPSNSLLREFIGNSSYKYI